MTFDYKGTIRELAEIIKYLHRINHIKSTKYAYIEVDQRDSFSIKLTVHNVAPLPQKDIVILLDMDQEETHEEKVKRAIKTYEDCFVCNTDTQKIIQEKIIEANRLADAEDAKYGRYCVVISSLNEAYIGAVGWDADGYHGLDDTILDDTILDQTHLRCIYDTEDRQWESAEELQANACRHYERYQHS